MLVFVLRRLVGLIPVGIGVVALVAMLAHVVPGDPVDAILGQYATQVDRDKLRHELGLDQPLGVQLLTYYRNIAQGDLGNSLILQRPVTSLIAERIVPTAELAVLAISVSICIALPLGILSAVFAGKIIDFVAMLFALAGIAMPNFWLGSMLIMIVSLKFDLLPVSGKGSWQTFILPSITLGVPLAAGLSRMTRNSMLDTFKEDFVRTAVAKGNAPWVVVLKHVLRNASLPLVTIIGLQFGVILTGAVITEVIFDWPGMGSLILEAVRTRDYPLIQGCILMFSATYLIVNLFTDISYALVDPRIKIANNGRS